MKTTGRIASLLALAATAIGILMFMKKEENQISSDGYIGKSNIVIEDGKMSPEALLAFGRPSDPQVSPDGKHILYGVSYTSVEENRSVRNLFICNIDGTGNRVASTLYGHEKVYIVTGINKIAENNGFPDGRSFSKAFAARFGISPDKYRKEMGKRG